MRIRKILAHYEPRIHPAREGYDVLDWSSAASQLARFAVLADSVDLQGKKLLDVGCGLGELLAFLDSRGIELEYTGVDLSEKMLEAARQRQAKGNFVCGDVFADDGVAIFGRGAFDVAFCSGTFNLDLGNNSQFVASAAERLTELAGQYVVFNLLDYRTSQAEDKYAYYRPTDVLAAMRPLGWDARIVDKYLPNDFTVILQHQPPGSGQTT